MLRYADRIPEAEQRYRQALKARPDDPRVLVGLALVLGDRPGTTETSPQPPRS